MKYLVLTFVAAVTVCLAVGAPRSASAYIVCRTQHGQTHCHNTDPPVRPQIPKANDPTGRLHKVNQQ